MRGGLTRAGAATDIFRPVMYWPLIGGFVAFVLLAVILGWVLDPSRRGDAEHDDH